MSIKHSSDCGMYGDIKLFAGTASNDLAEKISKYLKVRISDHTVYHFDNDNLWVRLHNSVRGQDVYIIQTTSRPIHRNIFELLITLQTLRLDSAGRVTAVVPYFSYGRSDKKDKPRTPITARLIADMIEVAGADRYMTLDLHAGQIQGFFSIPGDVISAFHILTEIVEERLPEMQNPVALTVDLGFAKKGRNFAAELDIPIAFVEKRRSGKKDHAEALSLIGDVKDRDVIIVDDEVDTAGSIQQAVQVAKENGAKDIYLTFIHPVFSPPAAKRLADLPIKQIFTTDTVPLSPENQELLKDKLMICSVAPLLGEVILRAHEGRSVGEMFNE